MNMKRINKILALTLALVMMTLCLTACGGGDSYTDYTNAYKKTASPGSLNVEFELAVTADGQDMESTGNMKMDKNNNLYYEMVINGKEITQYVTNGEIHTFVDGRETVASTDNKDAGSERGNPEGGENDPNEKKDGTAFNTDKFLEEFSGMLEAGKIKEMGVLDPIPSRYIKEITSKADGNEVVYTMTFPDEFLEVLLDSMTSEQTTDDGGISFSNLKDFTCVAKQNSDGYLYFIEYSGFTTVTVPGAYMEDGQEHSFDLDIDLEMTMVNPGTAVTVEIPG